MPLVPSAVGVAAQPNFPAVAAWCPKARGENNSPSLCFPASCWRHFSFPAGRDPSPHSIPAGEKHSLGEYPGIKCRDSVALL